MGDFVAVRYSPKRVAIGRNGQRWFFITDPDATPDELLDIGEKVAAALSEQDGGGHTGSKTEIASACHPGVPTMLALCMATRRTRTNGFNI